MTQTEASYKHELHHKEHCLIPLLFMKFAKNFFSQMKNLNQRIRKIHEELLLSFILNLNIP